MKEEPLHDLLRGYLAERIAEHDSDRAFTRATGIARQQFGKDKKGKPRQVSWGMLAKMSEKIGPPLSRILSDLALRVAAIEANSVATPASPVAPTSPKPRGVRVVTYEESLAESKLAERRRGAKAPERAAPPSHEQQGIRKKPG